MPRYSLWLVADLLGDDVLLVPESPEGAFGAPLLATVPEDVRRFLSAHGTPGQLFANSSEAVRRAREAEPRLFQVPATTLKAKELVGPLSSLLLRAYRTR